MLNVDCSFQSNFMNLLVFDYCLTFPLLGSSPYRTLLAPSRTWPAGDRPQSFTLSACCCSWYLVLYWGHGVNEQGHGWVDLDKSVAMSILDPQP